jgi:hypothetical protein
MFLSRRFPVRVRLEPAECRPWVWRANCPHGFAAVRLIITVPPFARGANLALPWGCSPRCYSGEAVIPKRRAWRARACRRMSRTVSPWTYRSALSWRTRNGVGLSPVSVVNRCTEARSRSTPSGDPSYPRDARAGPSVRKLGRCFSRLRSLAHRQGRSGPSPVGLAWPLRHRALLSDAGCVGPPKRTSSKVF